MQVASSVAITRQTNSDSGRPAQTETDQCSESCLHAYCMLLIANGNINLLL